MTLEAIDFAHLGIIVAPAVAAIASGIDLSVGRNKGLYLRAVPLCVLFVMLDATAAIILLIVLRAGAELLNSSPTTAAAVIAGLVGPLLMRTKIPVPFTNGRQVVNAVAMLRKLQIRVAAGIEDQCNAGETAWILDKVLPVLRTFPLSEVEAWVIQSINVKNVGPQARMLRRKYIEEVQRAADDPIKEEERKHLLVQILIDRCGRRQVTALVRRARKWSRRTGTSAPSAVPSQAPNELEEAAADNGLSDIDPDVDNSGDDSAEDDSGNGPG
jgi:hypothetical protein